MNIYERIEQKVEEIVDYGLEYEIGEIVMSEKPIHEPYLGIYYTDRMEDLKRDWKLKLEHLFEECFGNNADSFNKILEIVEFDFNASRGDDKFVETYSPEEVTADMILDDETEYFEMLEQYQKEENTNDN